MMPAASTEPAATLRRRAPAPSANAVTLLAVLACVFANVLIWASLNRPVAPPDFRGRVGGFAFSPFQRGQSPEDGAFPTRAEIRADLERVARISDRVRSYTVA